MTNRLDQANRIADLRERRGERVRREAQVRRAQCEAHKAEADHALMLQTQMREEAEHLLIADPADPQSQLWRTVNREREVQAVTARYNSHEELVKACSEADLARREHERCCERSRVLADQMAQQQRAMMMRADEREADDLAERLG
ncbi:hypothetical protein [Qipengyuania sp. DGS5-3]|uniref:hypothetical protein n=1 Tax=Qipengyuania sp. DGS5-3 TaxID=3349632 RepID=UPI0036D407BD